MKDLLSEESLKIIKENYEIVDKNIKDWVAFEKKKTSTITINADKKELFDKWIQYRKQIKKQLKSTMSINRVIETFNSKSKEEIEFVTNLSIDNGWVGLFWDKYKPKTTTSKYFI